MSRVSDRRIAHLIQWLEEPVVQRARWADDVLAALKELRRRRENARLLEDGKE